MRATDTSSTKSSGRDHCRLTPGAVLLTVLKVGKAALAASARSITTISDAYMQFAHQMPSAHEIALDVLRSFGPNVVAHRPPWTYGQYANAIGRDPAEYGLAIGKSMHAIGALCVIRQLPVAPLY